MVDTKGLFSKIKEAEKRAQQANLKTHLMKSMLLSVPD